MFGTFSDFLAQKKWDLGFFKRDFEGFSQKRTKFFSIVIDSSPSTLFYLVNNVTDFESCGTLNYSIILARYSKTMV